MPDIRITLLRGGRSPQNRRRTLPICNYARPSRRRHAIRSSPAPSNPKANDASSASACGPVTARSLGSYTLTISTDWSAATGRAAARAATVTDCAPDRDDSPYQPRMPSSFTVQVAPAGSPSTRAVKLLAVSSCSWPWLPMITGAPDTVHSTVAPKELGARAVSVPVTTLVTSTDPLVSTTPALMGSSGDGGLAPAA